MRPLEIVLPILIGVYVLWPAIAGRRRPRWVNAIPLLAVVVLLLHLLLEGGRWQMIPLYLLAGVTGCAGAWGLWRFRTGEFRRRSWRGAGLVGAAVVVAAAAALPALLPVPSVPPPTGPYAVGTVTLELVDDARAEIYADGAGAPRRFLIQIWYPALPERSDRRAPWMEDAGIVAPAIAEWLGLPPFFLDHLELARTSSSLDAPVDPVRGAVPAADLLARLGRLPRPEHVPDAGSCQPRLRGRGHGAHLRRRRDGLPGRHGWPTTTRRRCRTVSRIPSTRWQHGDWCSSGSVTWPSPSTRSKPGIGWTRPAASRASWMGPGSACWDIPPAAGRRSSSAPPMCAATPDWEWTCG